MSDPSSFDYAQDVSFDYAQDIAFDKLRIGMHLPRAAVVLRDMRVVLDALKARRGTGRRGRPPKAIAAVNAYEDMLKDAWQDWADDIAAVLAKTPGENWPSVVDDYLPGLLVALEELARRELPGAMHLGWGDTSPTADGVRALADAMDRNSDYLGRSLAVGVRTKVAKMAQDDDIILALATGEGEEAVRHALAALDARVATYSGAMWSLYNRSTGLAIDHRGGKLVAYLDPAAQHCSECPQFHSVEGTPYDSFAAYLAVTSLRVPGEFECLGRCRCTLARGAS